MAKMYTILGKAYIDTLTKTTGKPLTRISEEMGYASTYLKNIGISGRIRVGIADLIEAKYGISVAPYIIPDGYIVRKDGTGETIFKEEPKIDTESCEFRQMMDQIEAAIMTYIFGGAK